MKVIHIPFCFAPDQVGGTEVYVAQLARDLRSLGVDAMVAAPSDQNSAYSIDGLKVRRYAVTGAFADLSQMYGSGDLVAAREFDKILVEVKPDLIHLHAFTSAVSLQLVRAARTRGIPVVFTYHTPTASCLRGTMMHWGSAVCDGKMDVARCAACAMHGLGLPRPLAALAGRAPTGLGGFVARLGLTGKPWTMLRMSELVRMRHDAFRKMAAEVDCLIAVCDWVRAVLLVNGVPPEKVHLSRHGINWTPGAPVNPDGRSPPPRSEPTRIAFFGRFHRTKGIHIPLKALAMNRSLGISFDIYGIAQNAGDASYRDELIAMAGGDSRIRFLQPVPSSAVVDTLRAYDFLAVPSLWMETGPLVALEAFAAGVPVIGWNIGGVGEIVTHDVDGLLVEPDNATGWSDILRRVAGDAGLRARLKQGVRPPRVSMDVARDALALYVAAIKAK